MQLSIIINLQIKSTTFVFAILFPIITYAQLPQPNIYQAVKANEGIEIDSLANEPNWQTAPWSNDFVDIEGDGKTTPGIPDFVSGK